MADWTLYDGSVLKNMPDNVSDGEALNLVAKYAPVAAASAGLYKDLSREYDMTSGVPSLSAHFGKALARGNPVEVAAEFNKTFGKGNWGITENGSPYVYPEGLINIGQKPTSDKKVMLNSVAGDMYDVVGATVPIAHTAAAVGAELAYLIPHPVTKGAGFFAKLAGRALSPGLLARNVRAGAGVAASSMGIEGLQTLRGTQHDSIQKILTTAGVEGAAMTALGLVFGLPFSAVGSMTGGMKDAARKAGTQISMKNGREITATSVKRDLADWYESLAVAGKDPADFPNPTLKEMLSDRTGPISGPAASLALRIEGRGVREKEAAIVNKTLAFRNNIEEFLLGQQLVGKSPTQAWEEFSKTLTSLEKEQLNQFSKIVFNLEKHLGIDNGGIAMDTLIKMFGDDIKYSHTHLVNFFGDATLYGSEILNPAVLNVPVSNQIAARIVNDLVDELGLPPTQVLDKLGSFVSGSNAAAKEGLKRIRNGVTIKEVDGQFTVSARKVGEKVDDPELATFLAETAKASRMNPHVREAVVGRYDNVGKWIGDIERVFPGVTIPAALTNLAKADSMTASAAMLKDAVSARLKIYENGLKKLPEGTDPRTTEYIKSSIQSIRSDLEGAKGIVRKAEEYVPRKRAVVAPEAPQPKATLMAGDLTQAARALRQTVGIKPSEFPLGDIRAMSVGSQVLTRNLADVDGLPSGYVPKLIEVNKKYAAMSEPFELFGGANGKKYILETTAQNPEKLMNDLISGNKKDTFVEIFDAYSRIVEGKPGKTKGDTLFGGVGRAEGVRSADEMFGILTGQYIRHQMNKYNLNRLDLENTPVDQIRGYAIQALREFQKLERTSSEASFKRVMNRLFDTPLIRDYKNALKEVAEGNNAGVAKLKQHLTYKEAEKLVGSVSKAVGSMGAGAGGGSSLRTFRGELTKFEQGRALARKAGGDYEEQFIKSYGDMYITEMMSKLSDAGTMKYPEANAMLKNFADNFNQIASAEPNALRTILGDVKDASGLSRYDHWKGLALALRAAHNIEPNAGALNAAGMPFAMIGMLMRGDVRAAMHPLAFMTGIRHMAPGEAGWKQMAKAAGWPPSARLPNGELRYPHLNSALGGKNLSFPIPRTLEEGAEKSKDIMETALQKGRSGAIAILAGRDGAIAASIANYYQDADWVLPNADQVDMVPITPNEEVNQAEAQAIAPESRFADVGRNIVELINSVNKTELSQINIDESLEQGKAIAGAR